MMEWLGSNLLIVLLALGMLALAIWRVLRRPELLAGEGAVAWDTEQVADADATGAQLRLALFNPGRGALAAGADIGALSILAPEGARIVRAAPRLRRGVTGKATAQLHPDGGRFDLPPFALAPGGALIFDVHLAGSGGELRLIGRARRVRGWLRRRGGGVA